MNNPKLDYNYQDERRQEMLDGKLYAMASPSPNHSAIAYNLQKIFQTFLKGKQCTVHREVDVFFPSNNRFIPDLSVVCDKNKLKSNGIIGSPDLVIEILSPSTAGRDKGYKKRVYEQNGVKEYWLVDVVGRGVDVYLLENGKLEFNCHYTIIPDYTIEVMTDEEKSLIIYEFKTSLFNDLIITIKDIFEDMLDL